MLRLRLATLCRPAVLGYTRRHAARADFGGSSAWDVLGLSRSADLDECKDAYRRLALALHPDTNPSADAAARFAAVVEAYQLIAGGGARGGVAGPRGVHSVGGVLVVPLEALRQDPQYALYTCRLRLQENDGPVRAAPAPVGAPGAAPAESGGDFALSTEQVHVAACSPWDSVADLRQQLQEELELPPRLRYVDRRGRSGGHELIFRSQLLGEHLLLQDYDLVDGDTVHFAVRREVT